jgi:hypothetical protein
MTWIAFREHLHVPHMVEVRVRRDHGLDLVGRIAELLQLHVDHVLALLVRQQQVAESGGPVFLAVAVGDRDVVTGVEHDQPFG